MNIQKGRKHIPVSPVIFLISLLLYFIFTMPFRTWINVSVVTDMRLNSAITPVLGMIFGFPAAFGCAVSSFLCDVLSDYELSYSIFGFIQQFVFGLVPYYLWKRMNTEHDGSKFRLDSISRVLKFCLVMLIDAILIVIFTGLVKQSYFVSDFFSTDNLYLFLNSLDSGLLFGFPLLILGNYLQQYTASLQDRTRNTHVTLSLNERMIINTLLTGLSVCLLVGASIYLTDRFSENGSSIGLWGKIYLFQTIAMNIYFLLSIGFMWFTEKRIAHPIEVLAEIAQNYYAKQSTEEQRQEMIAACRKYADDTTEVGSLARSYISMAGDLEIYLKSIQKITAEKERINAELSLASDIQAHMLPCHFPAFPERDEFDIYATMTPAKEVGGDFYDFFMVDQTHIAVVIADVSGKGVPAALFMVIAKTLIRNHTQIGLAVNEVFTSVNRLLCEGNDACLFVTAWLGILDLSSGTLTYANAGHNPPLLCRNGQFTYLESSPGFVLAALDTTEYELNELALTPGDRLFLYTDGVTEAENSDHELYGEERLSRFINQHVKDSAEDILPMLKTDIDSFAGNIPQFDDITMLMLDFMKFASDGHTVRNDS